jgi:hypothetical protein
VGNSTGGHVRSLKLPISSQHLYCSSATAVIQTTSAGTQVGGGNWTFTGVNNYNHRVYNMEVRTTGGTRVARIGNFRLRGRRLLCDS